VDVLPAKTLAGGFGVHRRKRELVTAATSDRAKDANRICPAGGIFKFLEVTGTEKPEIGSVL
jgi:hypothetical protein